MKQVSSIVFSVFAFAAAQASFAFGWHGESLIGRACSGKEQGYGPFNYITQKNKLGVVEKHHFTPDVESLRRGQSSSIEGDLDYALRAFPNHHRALWAMARYYLRIKDPARQEITVANERLSQDIPPPECYFNRATRFAPDDGMVSLIFAIYLHKYGNLEGALDRYETAERLLPDNAELKYNMGLLYVDLDNLERAEKYAEEAAKLGYPLRGLHSKIERKKREGAAKQPVQK